MRARTVAGMQPLSPQRKWRAITIATLVLVPGYWAMLAGIVSAAPGTEGGIANPGAAIAFGLAIIPFVFLALALLSQHPHVPGAVLKAMGLSLLVGIPVSALAADVVTGIVAGVGAGGIAALRSDQGDSWRARAVGVVVASAYVFLMVRTVGAITLLPAPVFPFTALGLADQLSERRRERDPSIA